MCFLCRVKKVTRVYCLEQRNSGASFESPLKFKAIVNLPPPQSIRKIQILQGKSNFLRHFIVNYAKITKGFMHLLKQDTPLQWDEITQLAFQALKKALLSAPLLHPQDYTKDFILYLDASESTIGVFLFWENKKL